MKLPSAVSKFLFGTGAIFFVGCAKIDICNMTPGVLPQNQSKLYTVTMALNVLNSSVAQKTIKPLIVVDGQRHEMQQHPDGNNVFIYDCRLDGIGIIPYYFEVPYEARANRRGKLYADVAKSGIFQTEVAAKYIFALDANRGPVGARASVLGCGLTEIDRVRFGNCSVPVKCLSAGALEFVVPLMEYNREYNVYLLSGEKKFLAGTFFIDPCTIRCSVESIHLACGEKQRLVFEIDNPAGSHIDFDVRTDIPNSIIMEPVIHFNPGERTASIDIMGSEVSGEGKLSINADGFTSLEIPVASGDVGSMGAMEKQNLMADDNGWPQSPPNRFNEVVDEDIVVL
jgi:hypothetical protein